MDILKRNNVKVVGQGPRTMVMAHGFGCDQTMFRDLIEAFTPDYRIVLFDYVGSGGSDLGAYDERRYASLEGYKQDVLDVLAALDLRDVIFVAHSVSAMTGAMAAIEEPWRFSRLVMIAPSPRYLNDPPDYVGGFEPSDVAALLNMMEHNYTGWANYLAPIVMKSEARPGLASELAGKFCAMDPYIARRFAEVTFNSDCRTLLPKISIPSLIMQCTDDAIADIAIGQYLASHMPHASLRIMKATGHCPHLSQPEETIALIRDYLAHEPAPLSRTTDAE
jgi:sigma-B regulation protein RsbQ